MELRKIALGLLLAFAGSSLPAVAQDDFDPATPAEPNMRYKVKVRPNEQGVAYTSGAGTYTVGTSVWINTSANNTSYTFSHWLKDGVVYTTSKGFNYTVDGAVEFVAVYDFTPTEPNEPSGSYPRKLFLQSSMEGACSFNRTSGAKVVENSYVTVTAYPNVGFEFKGWYENSTLLSSNTSFSYYMTNADVTLTAVFEYNPTTPGDPTSSQTDIDNTEYVLGDANKDGNVTIGDIVAVVNIIAGNTGNYNLNAADANNDGTVSVGDIVTIVNIISGNN